MGTSTTNAIKKNYIWNKINSMGEVGLGYKEEKLIAEFCLDCSTSRKTALELLKIFEEAERIIRKNGKVYSRLFFNPDLTLCKEVFKEPDDEPLTEKRADEILAKEDLANNEKDN